MSEVRTRFAPSPTGYLHIGGARTALFNWLFARHYNGKFILRIEDTDAERSTGEAVDAIIDGLDWLGLDWDEGPYFQSERMDIYREHIRRMRDAGKAYRCYCAREELDEKRSKAISEGRKPKYDGTCRSAGEQPDKPFVIRFRSPDSGVTVVDDMIKGKVEFENSELDDLIIARTDGSPTYNFVVVVDDAVMEITHIIRGDDHLNNTPRQMLLYEAMGYKPPQFGHVPLILGADRKRLSKRHGATSVTAYRDMGFLPHSLVNYLARLGWSHGDQEIFSIEELIKYFSDKNIGKSSGVFNEEKLLWLNAHYIKEASVEELAVKLAPFLEKKGLSLSGGPSVSSIIPGLRDRSGTLVEMAQKAEFYFLEEIKIEDKAFNKFITPQNAEILKDVIAGLKRVDPFKAENLEDFFKDLAERHGLKLGKIAQPVRVAVTGGTVSPSIFEVIELLGKDVIIQRIESALSQI